MARDRTIYYKTAEEIELMRQSAMLVCKVHEHLAGRLMPGISGKQLDKEAEELIRDHGAEPSFLGYPGPTPFPASLCMSPNEVVVHGIPGDLEFRDGDIVSIDCGCYLNGFHGDVAYTYAVGEIAPEVMQLLQVTKASLYLGIDAAQPGRRIGDISHSIQHFVERQHGYGIVRELVGHGVGRNLHEAPEVPNFGKRGKGPKIQPGLVIAIEPMVNMGRKEVVAGADQWTVTTKDRQPSAHYEHTVAVLETGAEPLSDHRIIESAIRKNRNLSVVEDLRTVS